MTSLPLTIPRLIDTPVLQTARLTLRVPNGDDAPALIAFFAAPRSRFFFGPKSEGEAWVNLAARIGHWALRGYGMFAMVDNATGETVGLAGPVHPGDFPEPEMSWLLTEARHEGKGYVTEAARAVLDHLFATHGWASVVSYVDPENTASRAVARRLGASPDPATPSPIANCETWRHFAPAGEARA